MQIRLTVSASRRIGNSADNIVAILYLRVRRRSSGSALAAGKVDKFCDNGRSADIDGNTIDRVRLFVKFRDTFMDMRGDIKLAVDTMLEDLLFVVTGFGRDRYGQVGFNEVLAGSDFFSVGSDQDRALIARPDAPASAVENNTGKSCRFKNARPGMYSYLTAIRLKDYCVVFHYNCTLSACLSNN